MLKFQSMQGFLDTHQNDIFMFWVYRKVYTPYEQQQAFIDESMFEDSHANFGYIVECIQLGTEDFLLGIRTIADPDEADAQSCNGSIEYYKLSEIRMSLYCQPITKEE